MAIGLTELAVKVSGEIRMRDTFVCDKCGNPFPVRQMKEIFVWVGRKRVRRELCPSDLDKAMQAGRVSGIVGDEKKAAVQITPGVAPGERKPIK